jgi:hypothetical protein
MITGDKTPLDSYRPASPTQVSAADEECIGTLIDLVKAVDGAFATAERYICYCYHIYSTIFVVVVYGELTDH